MMQVLFYFFAAIILVSALGVVLLKNVVHSALLLGLCLAMVAGLYGLLSADFLFAAQVLIYVGAIALLFLFVVLLCGRRAEFSEKPLNQAAPAGLLAALTALALLAGVIVQSKAALRLIMPGPSQAGASTIVSIGNAILGPFAVGMEIVGFILLTALVGAVLLTKRSDKTGDVKEE
ncbi:MAG: NADH-quinone oxidoreductase subunit J [Elusimicrobia bacterium]|nr:NADH-quinone oxidoreductase subunit J [Elusimicrobiota bacterium]